MQLFEKLSATGDLEESMPKDWRKALIKEQREEGVIMPPIPTNYNLKKFKRDFIRKESAKEGEGLLPENARRVAAVPAAERLPSGPTVSPEMLADGVSRDVGGTKRGRKRKSEGAEKKPEKVAKTTSEEDVRRIVCETPAPPREPGDALYSKRVLCKYCQLPIWTDTLSAGEKEKIEARNIFWDSTSKNIPWCPYHDFAVSDAEDARRVSFETFVLQVYPRIKERTDAKKKMQDDKKKERDAKMARGEKPGRGKIKKPSKEGPGAE